MINKCIIIGRITFSPEIKRTPSDMGFMNNVLAVDRDKKNESGEKVTDFIPITVWGKSAEYLYNYASKGSLIAVVGSLRVDTFKAKDGTDKKKYYINAENVNILSYPAQKPENPAPKPQKKEQKPLNDNEYIELNLDEDLPF